MRRFLPVYAKAIYAFLYLPLFTLSVFSFNNSKLALWSGFTTAWYGRLWSDRVLLEGTINSLVIAIVASSIATVAGTLAGYALWKRRSLWVTNALYLSLITPEIVTGVSLLALFQFLFHFLHWQLGLGSVILAHSGFCLAYAVIVVLARLRTLDPALEEAAADLGANDWEAFRYVTLPLLLPAVLAAGLLCFTVSFDDYVITSLVAGVDSETLPMVVYSMARKGVNPEVNAISVLITGGLGLLILLAGKLEGSSESSR